VPQLARNYEEQYVMHRVIGGALAAAAAGAVKVAAKLAPRREVDFFTHRSTKRRPWRIDAWKAQPGWVFVEVGQWTLEVAWKTREELQGAQQAAS
jgi:hypothetical protein